MANRQTEPPKTVTEYVVSAAMGIAFYFVIRLIMAAAFGSESSYQTFLVESLIFGLIWPFALPWLSKMYSNNQN